ncbi:hypothetical protein SEA_SMOKINGBUNNY_4 [Gordonia phage SmokingBunny]|uniref:Uncharacterized protein n=2 Tax=Wizardvirus TaxID=2169658 RepID=A0A6M3T0J0_9CAUD|nr:hypothetical protein KNU53_gp04 [Gordonia phage SmokingBunny]YP_010107640.1 hypothetical protein KNV01_gp04 [Gordonia phage Evamon]UVK62329.1 hypothetical protein SEA_SALVADOR_4 [Gordonia phage Salvador]WAA20222.1 hypothetical protein SEA_TOGO_4 [Gordonia phage Togo]QCG77815.1 hypothetical protein SEA_SMOKINGBUNNY_4 [Gordonia phage SmokingBunny]QJD51499.1 hypothetical protein SEA_EVAMON_4 [Gordonia phage Evamon]
MSAWSVLADAGIAIGASYPCFWASWKAGWRYAEWRDLIRQERAIDRAARATPPVRRAPRSGGGQGDPSRIPPPGSAGVVTGRWRQSVAANSSGVLVLPPAISNHFEEALRKRGLWRVERR